MKKKIVITGVCLFAALMSFAQKDTDDFSGKWKTPEGKIIVITKQGSGFIGMTEDKTKTVLKDVTFNDGKWRGSIIKPDDGTTVNCELTREGSNLNVVAKKGMFSKKLTWIKQ